MAFHPKPDSTDERHKLPEVIECYSDYSPPFDVKAIVVRMLESVPSKYLLGLDEVVLTNSGNLPRARRRAVTKSRKKKVRIVRALGLYHAAWRGSSAWIEIFVDNILATRRGWWFRWQFLREGLIGDVLFHEIGHHIHATARPEFREREDVADVWKVRLKRRHNAIHHKWLRLFFLPFRPLLRLLGRAMERRWVERGWTSRAEFEERWGKKRQTKV
jgi:hypothetical protein